MKIRTLANFKYEIDISANSTVRSIKQSIAAKLPWVVGIGGWQRLYLVYKGKILNNGSIFIGGDEIIVFRGSPLRPVKADSFDEQQQEYLETIVSLGFTQQQAVSALHKFNFDAEEAILFLMRLK